MIAVGSRTYCRAVVAAALVASVAGRPLNARSDGGPRATDSLRVRVEVGGSSDYSNEVYYLDSLATPTLTQRQRFDLPQARYAGVALLTLEGTRDGGATGYALSQEVSVGDRLKRASLLGRWRQAVGPDWRLLLIPRAEYRKDQTLGRDFEEYQAAVSARARKSWSDGVSAAEAGVHGDWLHTAGAGAGLLLDRWSAGVSASLEHGDYQGAEWRCDYAFRERVFPDSSVRDHFEHEAQGRMRFGWGTANFLVMDATALRRLTTRTAPTSLDNFWEETGVVEVVQNAAGWLGWPARADVEAVQFDLQDDVLYFNHQQLRARTGARLQGTSFWTLELGPVAEWLSAPRAPTESYGEWGGFAELEAFASGSLWSVTPAIGYRRFEASTVAATATSNSYQETHSSYHFFELDVFGDQRLPGGWRARVTGNSRWEYHAQPVENAGSLYFSLDVRRLF